MVVATLAARIGRIQPGRPLLRTHIVSAGCYCYDVLSYLCVCFRAWSKGKRTLRMPRT